MLALAVAAILGHRQGLSAPVSYVTRAARADVVLPALGKLAGVDLRASKDTANEILVISVKDTPLTDILPRIATVTSGEWKHDGNTLRLVPNRDLRRKQDSQEIAHRIDDIRRHFASRHKSEDMLIEMLKHPDKKPVGQPPSSPGELKEELITSQLATKLLEGIGADTVASSDHWQVFSTAPIGSQRPFGDGAPSAVDEFIKAYNRMGVGTEPDYLSSTIQVQAGATNRIGRVAGAQLIIKLGDPSSDESPIVYRLQFFDTKGSKVFDTGTVSENFTQGLSDDETGTSPKVEYSQDSIAFLKAVGAVAGGDEWGMFPDRMLPALLQPLSHDPLSYYQTDEILSFAKAKGKPLVADLPDDWGADQVSLLSEPTQQTVHDIATELKEGKWATQITDPNFTVVMPSRPVHSRAIRIDRQSIARLIAAGESKGIASLDDLVDFANANSFVLPTGMMFAYLTGIVPPMVQMDPGGDNWDGLAFYSELSRDQRALPDTKFPVGTLSAKQLAVATRMLSEESIANVELSVSKASFAARVDPSGMHAALSADEIARVRTPQAEPDEEQPTSKPPAIGTVRMGTATVYRFTFRASGGGRGMSTLHDYSVDKTSKVYGATSLPPDFEKEVNRLQKEWVELRKTLSSHTKGGQIPPTP